MPTKVASVSMVISSPALNTPVAESNETSFQVVVTTMFGAVPVETEFLRRPSKPLPVLIAGRVGSLPVTDEERENNVVPVRLVTPATGESVTVAVPFIFTRTNFKPATLALVGVEVELKS